MENGFEEFSTVELGIPSLSVKRTKLPNGGFRAIVTVTKAVWDKEKKRPATGPSRNVGVVANDQEFGPIVFKESFLNEFPQLRKVTVLRKEGRKYVYIKTPLTVDDKTIGYHQRGRKRYEPPKDAASTTKLYGATMLCSKEAERYGISQALKVVFGKRKASLILAIAIALVLIRRCSLKSVKLAADYIFLSTDELPLSKGSMTYLSKSITTGQGKQYFALMTQSLLKLGEEIAPERAKEVNQFALDGSAIASYSANNPLVEPGHRKKDNPGIDQFNLMFLTHMFTGISCYMRHIAGNIPDISAYLRDADFISEMDRVLGELCGDDHVKLAMTQVFDRGFVSYRNMGIAAEKGFDFVCLLPRNIKPAKEAKAYAISKKIEDGVGRFDCDDSVHHMAMPSRAALNILNHDNETIGKLWLHVYYDPLKYHDKAKELYRLGAIIKAAHKDGRYDELPDETKSKDKRLKLVKKFKGKGGTVKWGIDDKAVRSHAYESAFWVLGTTRKDFDGEEVLLAYRNRNKVEDSIKTFKGMGFDRLGSGNYDTMFGRLFLFFVSCQLEQCLHFTAKRAKRGDFGREPSAWEYDILSSTNDLIALMNGITCEVSGKEVKVNEIAGIRRKVLELMGYPIQGVCDDDDAASLATLANQALTSIYTSQDAYEEGLSVRSQ